MRALAVCVALVVLCAAHTVAATAPRFLGWRFKFGGSVGGSVEDPRIGSPCTPRYPRKCGEPRLVDEYSEPADDCG